MGFFFYFIGDSMAKNSKKARTSSPKQHIPSKTLSDYTAKYYPINYHYHDEQKFVFFQSLLEKPTLSLGNIMGLTANRLLYLPKHNPTKSEINESSQKIQQALRFLKSAAELERRREEQFIAAYTKKSPQIRDMVEKSKEKGQNQYLALVNQFNISLKGLSSYRKELQKEIKRIKDRKEIKKRDDAALAAGRHVSTKGSNGETVPGLTAEEYAIRRAIDGDGVLGDTVLQPYYNLDGNKIFNGLMSERSTFGKIISKIIIKYGARLFQIKKDELQLNSAQFSALLVVITQKAYEMLATEFEGGVRKAQGESAEALNQRVSKNLESLLNNDSMLNTYVDDLLNLDNLGDFLGSISKQYGIANDPKTLSNAGVQTRSFTTNLKKSYEELKAQGKTNLTFKQWRKKYAAEVPDIKDIMKLIGNVKVQGYYTSENLSVSGLVDENVVAYANGNKNTTDDYEAGRLIFTFEYDDSKDRIKEKLDDAKKKIAAVEKEMGDQLNKTTDLNSYLKNEAAVSRALDKEIAILEELKSKSESESELMEEMYRYIHVHGTVKGYASIGSTTDAFEGAAFGEDISSQVEIITAMVDAGGISIADKDWLLFALLNCGKGMIGSENKRSLEDYLSAFVGLLMFNGSSTFFKDAVDFMTGKYQENSAFGIHLYTLNNVYIPNSYILNETYRYLAKMYGELEQNAGKTNQGIRLTLDTYNPKKTSGFEPEELLFPKAERWVEESQNALKKNKLTITFMGGFLDLLNSLEKQMADLDYIE